MKKKPIIVAGAVAASAALVGGVFAAVLPNIVGNNFLVGQEDLIATCLSADTAVVEVTTDPTYALGAWSVSEADVSITDPTSAPINCVGETLTLYATGASGAELAVGTYTIAANGDIAATVTLAPTVDAYDLQGWAVKII